MASDPKLKLSQPGYDVRNAGDQNLAFSSDFPILKEAYTDIFDHDTLSDSAFGYYKVFDHNLGYVPFFLVFNKDSQMVIGTDWAIDEKALYVAAGATDILGNPVTGKYRWNIYRLNIFQDYRSPVPDIKLPAAGGVDFDFGIKVAKRGRDLQSTDLRDFTIHSRARSPLLHIVDHKEWKDGDAQHIVDPELPYNPICFGFARELVNNKVYNMITGGQAAPKLTRQSDKIQIDSGPLATSDTSIVVFKDPFVTTNYIKTSY